MYHCQKDQISAIILMHTDWTITERFITIKYITITCNMCQSEILIKLKISSSNYFFTGELPLLFLVNFVKTSYLTYFWPLEQSPISIKWIPYIIFNYFAFSCWNHVHQQTIIQTKILLFCYMNQYQCSWVILKVDYNTVLMF